MAVVKIGDLLDLSSPLAASISPNGERPRSGGTVHHHPPNYTPQDTSGRRREGKPGNHIAMGYTKVKEEEDEKCPNVLVRNGVICTPYRTKNGRREECVTRRWNDGMDRGNEGETRNQRSHVCKRKEQETGIVIREGGIEFRNKILVVDQCSN